MRQAVVWVALWLAPAAAMLLAAPGGTAAQAPSLPTVSKACDDDNPYFATTRLTAPAGAPGAAVVAFYDTPDDDRRQQLALATAADVGAVYGLAYDWRRAHLYAAAYHRRDVALGPGGPGQIYRIDLRTGAVEPFARLAAGPDRHTGGVTEAAWVGRSAWGDIEVDGSGEQLLAMNLHDGRVHRLRLPDGLSLGSFAHGGAAAAWADRARPFGLGAREGWAWHGVVELPDGGTGPARAHVYRSAPDGSAMTEAAAFDLDYDRQPAWGGWSAAGDGLSAEPMLVDIEFRPDGTPVVGLRDRRADADRAVGAGDLLPLRREGAGWQAVAAPEHYEDRFVLDESILGGLAAFPGVDLLVAAATAPLVAGTAGGVWFDNASGTAVTRETVAMGAPGGADARGALGDVEVLCGPPGAPTLAPTPTPTATPTPPPPAFLPLTLRERCLPWRVDVALVLDLSTSMAARTPDDVPKHAAATAAARGFLDLLDLRGDAAGDRAALVAFNATTRIAQPLTGDRQALVSRLATLGGALQTGSRLDLALETGASALADSRRTERLAVLVLLSDGLPTGVPPAPDGSARTTVLDAAAGVRAAGIRVYAIGFGRSDELDGPLLAAVAGDPSRYRETPAAAELAEIYAGLASLLRCPPGRHRWGEPWP